MHPKVWRIKRHKLLKHVADDVGCTPQAVSQYERGIVIPSIPQIARFEDISNRQVTAADFVNIYRDNQRRAQKNKKS